MNGATVTNAGQARDRDPCIHSTSPTQQTVPVLSHVRAQRGERGSDLADTWPMSP
eukprot:CAMPEP_0175875284 /NCGR_PEP_ID=MMETSP0107_2-20121207/39370_1 /TAXON_ID=195067 ORGANISM="Goniomonas pacifica, Strain CCMP1869" /NCGR_SAMPLE_ID=MMETSP0107_2 /ASSEMBLY_ACC=CAM_ASM_000203 /LENGTH=54 /DNA_ID=CAMNT_0017194287 /DNA_START=541 /DNA_END=702 /DNA_ORIENTATION=-